MTSTTDAIGTIVRIAFAALALALLFGSGTAAAATINVTTTSDEFDAGPRCSLREAIWSANNDLNASAPGCVVGNGTDTIVVPAGTYRLSRNGVGEDLGEKGDLDVTAPASIIHTGIQPAVIDGQGSDRVFHTSAPGGVTISGLVIRDGSAPTADGDNTGGGILGGGRLTITNTTIAGNRATFGGGLATSGASTVTLTNVTVTGNSAAEDGGGVDVEPDGSAALSSVTVTGNVADSDRNGGGGGGGLDAVSTGSGGQLNLRNTLVAGNTDTGGEAPDCIEFGGTIRSLGRSLIGDTTGCDYSGGPGDITNRSPKLSGLEHNGGPTPTHALRKGSPAIDKAGTCPRNDQRGLKRSLGRKCDIGAYERARCEGALINRIGTGGSDRLAGTEGRDGILGGNGSDLLQAFGGNDGLCGGAGNDSLEGGPGADDMDGGPGARDECLGGAGKDNSRRCELPRKKKR